MIRSAPRLLSLTRAVACRQPGAGAAFASAALPEPSPEPAQYAALQECLSKYGFGDLSKFAQPPANPQFASEEFVRGTLEPRLSMLRAAGVEPGQLEAALLGHRHPMLCDLDTFLHNLQELKDGVAAKE